MGVCTLSAIIVMYFVVALIIVPCSRTGTRTQQRAIHQIHQLQQQQQPLPLNKPISAGMERETDRQTDRQRERERETDRERGSVYACIYLGTCVTQAAFSSIYCVNQMFCMLTHIYYVLYLPIYVSAETKHAAEQNHADTEYIRTCKVHTDAFVHALFHSGIQVVVYWFVYQLQLACYALNNFLEFVFALCVRVCVCLMYDLRCMMYDV